MLVEMAVADAYAIAWEFTKDQKAVNDLTAYHQHPSYAELSPGQYTDDTQRAIGNARVILGSRASDIITPEAYATSYLLTYQEDPREGYSRGFQAFLKSVKDPSEFLLKVQRTKISNGSVMGVAPLGFIPDLATLKLAALVQATTTHHAETAIHAQLVAMMSHYFLHGPGRREQLREYLLNEADWVEGTDQSYRWEYLVDQHASGKPTGIKASSISSYVLYVVETFESLSDIVRDAVDRGGDTDSAAASAVAVASCCEDIANDLPQVLVDTLEPGGTRGVEYLRTLELALRQKAKLV